MNRDPYPPPGDGQTSGQAGRWSGGWAGRQKPQYNPEDGRYYNHGTGQQPPPGDGGRFSRDPREYGWNAGPGGGPGYPPPGMQPPAPEKQLRQTIKRTVKLVLPALLILFLVEYLFAFAVSFGISAYISQASWSFTDYPPDTYFGIPYGLYDLLTSYLPVVVGEAAAILFLRARTGFRLKDFFAKPEVLSREPGVEGGCREPERAPLSGGKLALWVAFASLAGIGVSMIGQIFAMVELNFLYEIGFPYYSPDFSTGGYTLLDTILCNLYICVLGPVLEELIFRGFMLRALQRHGSAFAVIFTSVMFMLFHMNLVQLFTPLLTGMFLALLAVKTRSLIPSICCHILNNTLSTVLSYIPFESDFAAGMATLAQIAVFILIFACFWMLWGRQFLPLMRDRDPAMKLSGKLGAAFTAWPSVTFILIYIGMIIYSTLMTWLSYYYY